MSDSDEMRENVASTSQGDVSANTPSVFPQPERHSAEEPSPPVRHHWKSARNRWLLTLNPGRTQDEYEKAIRYFFETPSVPQGLEALSYDLLLAYRGALALRADRRRRSTPRRGGAFSGRLGARSGPLSAFAAISGASDPVTGETTGETTASGKQFRPASLRTGPLSPATVNIRLTALRQFLLFAHEQDLIPQLTAERIRSALRRLKNERRRPYQILAEEEWDEFLHAALLPAEHAKDTPSAIPDHPPASSQATPKRGPWGVTRAEREQARQRLADEAEAAVTTSTTEEDAPEPPTSAHMRRTGAHTAQRDHALISLALATGLRAIELSLLDVGDLVSERRRGQTEWWLVLPDEKTKGQRGGRSLPLAPDLMTTLLAYVRATGRSWDTPEHRETPLFLALSRGPTPTPEGAGARDVARAHEQPERRYRRLRPEQIRGVIHRVESQWQAQRRAAEEDAEEPTGADRRISPHALRHSAAIALLLGDEASERPPASVEHVRGWLGHFDIRTTQRYLSHIESRDQRRRFAIRPQTRKPPTAPEVNQGPTLDQPTLFDGE